MSFSIEVHQNEYLPRDVGEMHAVITVTSEGGEPAAPTDKAIVLVVDASTSMDHPSTKLRSARQAAAAAIKVLPDGTLFALVVGNHEAHSAYPASGGGLARASEASRAEAVEIAGRLRTSGGTSISTWIDHVRRLLEPHPGAIRLAYLMTDGKNESEPPQALDTALARAAEVFQCDTRGAGDQCEVAELRKISSALLGKQSMIRSPEEMKDDFLAFIDRAIGKNIADVWLRVRTPMESTVRFFRQVQPTIEHISDKAVVTGTASDYPTGAWSGAETRDYHLCVDIPPADVGKEKRAAHVSIVRGADELSNGLVRAVWTDDVELSTRINREVAVVTDRVELANRIQEGVHAIGKGDYATATLKLGEAARLATEAGDEVTLTLLRDVIDIDDAASGTVRLRPDCEKMALDVLDSGSGDTETIRLRDTVAVGQDRVT